MACVLDKERRAMSIEAEAERKAMAKAPGNISRAGMEVDRRVIAKCSSSQYKRSRN